jgi:hypothetical protein
VHFNKPIDGPASLADHKPIGGEGKRDGLDIDTVGEAPVELDFGFARRLAFCERGEVQIGKSDRLFQLERQAFGQKDVRHVCFANVDSFKGGAVRSWFAQKRELVVQRRVGSRRLCKSVRAYGIHMAP